MLSPRISSSEALGADSTLEVPHMTGTEVCIRLTFRIEELDAFKALELNLHLSFWMHFLEVVVKAIRVDEYAFANATRDLANLTEIPMILGSLRSFITFHFHPTFEILGVMGLEDVLDQL